MKKGWEVKKLGEVCELIARGISPKYSEGSGLVVLNQKCIRDHKINLTQARFHDDRLKKVSHEKFIQKGDVLINSTGTGTLGRVAQVREDVNNIIVDSHVSIVRPLPNLFVNDFFGWALIRIEDQIANSGEGCGGQTELSRNTLKNDFEISYPKSFDEQQRIATILDETFAAIDQAKVNVQRNLQNTEELFQSELNNIFANKGEGWEETELGNLITILTDYHANGSYEVLKANVELKNTEDYAWMVRSTDFENNFKNDFRYIDQQAYEYLKKSKVFGGDLIISKIGNAGKVYLMPMIDRPCSLAMNLFLLRVDKHKAEAEFIYQYLNSVYGEKQIKSRLRGTATKTITKDNVRSISIPYPALDQQKQIIVQLQSLSEETENLSAVYQQKLNTLDELKKSILQKVFSGELTATKEIEYDLERSI